MHPEDYLRALVNRRVAHRHRGIALQFELSTALFSSAGVDAGTVQLLRCLETTEITPSVVRDIGCGTGTLGISLAAGLDVPLLASDRDALACWFTDRNAGVNNVRATTVPALGARLPAGAATRGDVSNLVVVCNIPAKAGEPVLRHLVREAAAAGGESGRAGLVIVSALADLLENEVGSLRLRVESRRQSKGHLAIVVAPVGTPNGMPVAADTLASEAGDLDKAYLRGTHDFTGPAGSYSLTSVYNLPEFDSFSYETELLFRLMKRQQPGGRIFVWGVGQGHIPIGATRREFRGELVIADRDLLALRVTAYNLSRLRPGCTVTELVEPSLACAAAKMEPGSVDWMIVRSTPEPGSMWAEELAASADHALDRTGKLMVVSRSASISRLEPHLRARFSQSSTIRARGNRADLIERKR